MENTILVSICIPTYNRSQYLRSSLESLVIQDEFKNGKVEVIISDNASTDATEALGRKFSSTYTNVRYYRNKNNIADANFPTSFSFGKGKLLKLCNDTLIYKEGSLKLFCENVEKYIDDKPMLYFSNGNKDVDFKQGELNFEQFMLAVTYWSTWIGSFSWWKCDFDNMGADNESASTHLWQVNQICRIMSTKNKAVIIPDPFCTTQTVQKKDISYGIYQVFYENFLGIINAYTDSTQNTIKIPIACYDQLKKDLLLKFFPSWIVDWELQSKKLDYSKSENLKDKIVDTYKNEPYYMEFESIYKKMLFKRKINNIIDQLKAILRKNYRNICKRDRR
jgi:glycosyltransferase involved in cell wall biosynthesis